MRKISSRQTGYSIALITLALLGILFADTLVNAAETAKATEDDQQKIVESWISKGTLKSRQQVIALGPDGIRLVGPYILDKDPKKQKELWGF